MNLLTFKKPPSQKQFEPSQDSDIFADDTPMNRVLAALSISHSVAVARQAVPEHEISFPDANKFETVVLKGCCINNTPLDERQKLPRQCNATFWVEDTEKMVFVAKSDTYATPPVSWQLYSFSTVELLKDVM